MNAIMVSCGEEKPIRRPKVGVAFGNAHAIDIIGRHQKIRAYRLMTNYG